MLKRTDFEDMRTLRADVVIERLNQRKEKAKKRNLERLKEKEKRRGKLERQKLREAQLRAEEREKLRQERRAEKLRREEEERIEREFRASGDERGTFWVVIMRNREALKVCGERNLKSEAFRLYTDMVVQNKQEVTYPTKVMYVPTRVEGKGVPVTYEILIIQKTDTPFSPLVLRDDNSNLSMNRIADSDKCLIIAKHSWLVDKTFLIFSSRKTFFAKRFPYVMKRVVLRKPESFTRVFVYNDKVICHYDSDLEFVLCDDHKEATELYDVIERHVDKEKYPRVLFMGEIQETSEEWILEELQKKTEWKLEKCVSGNPTIGRKKKNPFL